MITPRVDSKGEYLGLLFRCREDGKHWHHLLDNLSVVGEGITSLF
jgi:hypothetical protein